MRAAVRAYFVFFLGGGELVINSKRCNSATKPFPDRAFTQHTKHKTHPPHTHLHPTHKKPNRILGQEKELKAAAEALAHTNAKGPC